jgi:hypothetical protein
MSWDEIPNMLMDNAVEIFGVDCVFNPKDGGESSEFKAIFDNKYTVVDKPTGMSIQTSAPNISLNLSDLSQTPKKGDEVVIGEKTYQIKEINPDGQGGAKALLYEQ